MMQEPAEVVILTPDQLPFDIALLGPRLPAEEIERLPYFEFLAYNGLTDLHPGGAVASQKLLAVTEPRKGERVLEIGCGSGATAERFADRDCIVFALDVSKGMLSMCAKRQRRKRHGRLHALRADMSLPLPISDEALDIVVCEGALGFIENKLQALREARRTVSRSGRMAHLGFYYRDNPSPATLHFMQKTFGTKKPTKLSDWHELYHASGWKIVQEEIFDNSRPKVSQSPLLPKILRAVEDVMNPNNSGAGEVLEQRLTKILSAVTFNQRNLSYAIWLLRPA